MKSSTGAYFDEIESREQVVSVTIYFSNGEVNKHLFKRDEAAYLMACFLHIRAGGKRYNQAFVSQSSCVALDFRSVNSIEVVCKNRVNFMEMVRQRKDEM